MKKRRTWTAKDVAYVQALAQDTISLETKIHSEDGADDSELGEFIEDTAPTPEEVVMIQERKRIIREYVKKFLSPREELVIVMRYGLETGTYMTLEQVGEKFGVTRERIRQIEVKAMKKLKAGLKNNNILPEDL